MKLDEVCQGKVSKKKVRNLIFGWVGVCPFFITILNNILGKYAVKKKVFSFYRGLVHV